MFMCWELAQSAPCSERAWRGPGCAQRCSCAARRPRVGACSGSWAPKGPHGGPRRRAPTGCPTAAVAANHDAPRRDRAHVTKPSRESLSPAITALPVSVLQLVHRFESPSGSRAPTSSLLVATTTRLGELPPQGAANRLRGLRRIGRHGKSHYSSRDGRCADARLDEELNAPLAARCGLSKSRRFCKSHRESSM